MCTAATYRTKDFYFGRTLDYERSYGDAIDDHTAELRRWPYAARSRAGAALRHDRHGACGRAAIRSITTR